MTRHRVVLDSTHCGATAVERSTVPADSSSMSPLASRAGGRRKESHRGARQLLIRATIDRSWKLATILAAFSTVALAVDGVPDPTFGGGDGFASFEFFPASPKDEWGRCVATDPGGRLVAAGGLKWSSTDWDFGISRLLPDGSLDPSYGVLGTQYVFFDPLPATSYDEARGVAVDAQGRAWVVGKTSPASDPNDVNFAFVRLTASGAVEPGSQFTYDSGVPDTFGQDIVLVSATRAFVAGQFGDYPGLFRIDDNGVTFATLYVFPTYSDGILTAIAAQSDGKLVAAGWARYSVNPQDLDLVVVRVDQDLQLDPSFGVGGVFTFNTTHANPNDVGSDVIVLGDGRIIVAYTLDDSLDRYASLVALSSSGALLGAFNPASPSARWFNVLGAPGSSIFADPHLAGLSDGSFVVGSSVDVLGTESWRFRRLRPVPGQPQFFEIDPTFGNVGNADVASFGLQGLTLDGGRPVAVGYYPDVTDDFVLVRLAANLLFSDGFESSSTSSWSRVGP